MTAFTKKSIAITVTDGVPFTQTADGNLVVHGTAAITSPASAGIVSWEHNRSGSAAGDLAMSGVIGVRLDPGDTLVVAKSVPGQDQREGYFPAPGRSQYAEMLSVVCVDWGPQKEPFLRPPAIGFGPAAEAMRKVPLFESRLRVDQLPSVIDMSRIPNAPPLAVSERLFSDFGGDIFSGWSTNRRTPNAQHPGYGVYLSAMVGIALLWANSTIPWREKVRLVRGLSQWGFDLGGAFAGGRDNRSCDGGHMLARKPLIQFLGWLLRDRLFMDPSASLGRPSFAEDFAFTDGTWWDGTTKGLYHKTQEHNCLVREPWTWSGTEKFLLSYMGQVVGGQIGIAVAMHLLGLAHQHSQPLQSIVNNWMAPRLATVQAMEAVGVELPFGEDYTVGYGVGVARAAWLQVQAGARPGVQP